MTSAVRSVMSRTFFSALKAVRHVTTLLAILIPFCRIQVVIEGLQQLQNLHHIRIVKISRAIDKSDRCHQRTCGALAQYDLANAELHGIASAVAVLALDIGRATQLGTGAVSNIANGAFTKLSCQDRSRQELRDQRVVATASATRQGTHDGQS